jgi:DNA-directed RNA polymerase specialized sigma24 family protein
MKQFAFSVTFFLALTGTLCSQTSTTSLQGTITLARAIRDLPAGYRKIFLLHEVQGYGHQEIARMLECSVGNSKSQLSKARLRIREFLGGKTEAPRAVAAQVFAGLG